jgi:cytochrome oxidase Cu insertion factor (SCO1/SenC/PrrC family)
MLGFTLTTSVCLLLYYYREKSHYLDKVIDKNSRIEVTGQAVVGGSFEMVTENGQNVTDADFNGYFKLLYFGFTNCPDSK